MNTNRRDFIRGFGGIAALAAFGAFGFWKHSQTIAPGVEIECLFRLPASAQSLPIAVGDEVRNENGTIYFGRVISVSERPYRTVFLRNGIPVYEAVEGLSEQELTVRMSAEKNDAYRVGDVRVCAGGSGTYRIGSALVSGVCIIQLAEDGGTL